VGGRAEEEGPVFDLSEMPQHGRQNKPSARLEICFENGRRRDAGKLTVEFNAPAYRALPLCLDIGAQLQTLRSAETDQARQF